MKQSTFIKMMKKDKDSINPTPLRRAPWNAPPDAPRSDAPAQASCPSPSSGGPGYSARFHPASW